ncbi:unnamed protein product [Coffea canephora]|uniref:UBP-type domain-containing protein n=1 Tax=Coffea canephora TaxID=49390 RepID=A0A068US29_COFCA|nr:unnamed protein product [Coffea canephora]
MFTLQIHSVDSPQRLPITVTSATHGPNRTASDACNSLNSQELRGIAHLFRQLLPPSVSSTAANPNSTPPTPSTTIANPTARTTQIFIVAVPNYLSSDDFLLFCGTHVDHFLEILFVRNDAVEDRYSVLISLANQLAADGFYCSFNGKRFRPSEAEVCHIYFTQSVEYTEVAEIASTPPPGFTELPTCPICLERLDQDTSGIQSTLCDHSFYCSCVSKWTYLSCQVCRLCQQQDEKPTCAVCETLENLWVCLICGFVGCARYEKGHAVRHSRDTEHNYSLKLETQQIWDYVGDKYVHRLNQSKADGKSGVMNSHCISNEGECGTCGYEEDSGLDGVLFSSKVETTVDEYNHLLASQLEIQRQHYESLLAEAKNSQDSTISKAVEKTLFSRMHDLQYRLERYTEEKKAISERNQELMKKQELLQQKYKDIEAMSSLTLKSKDEMVLDLKEQIRDLKVYLEAQKKIAKMTDREGVKGGTLLPVEATCPSSGNPKRRAKSGRRRG